VSDDDVKKTAVAFHFNGPTFVCTIKTLFI